MRYIPFLISILFITGLKAQDALPAVGGEAAGAGGTVSYTIGQVFYTTDSSSQGSIAKGVQHAYEIFTVSVKQEAHHIQLNVYPNPTKDYIQLSCDLSVARNLQYHLYGNDGKLIWKSEANDAVTTIEMEHLASATYFLSVFNNGQEIRIFKIIKN